METSLAKIDNDSMPFWLMDKLDDEQIIQQLEGKMPDVLTYHFQDGGKEIWGLSKAGVDEAKIELSKKGEVLRVLDVQFIDGDKDGKFIVKVGRYAVSNNGLEVLLDTTAGFKKQDKLTATGKENKFWFEQGGVKAQRNAFHSLIPKTIIQGVIEYAKKSGKVKEVEKPKEKLPAEALLNQSKKLIEEVFEEQTQPTLDERKRKVVAKLKSIGMDMPEIKKMVKEVTKEDTITTHHQMKKMEEETEKRVAQKLVNRGKMTGEDFNLVREEEY